MHTPESFRDYCLRNNFFGADFPFKMPEDPQPRPSVLEELAKAHRARMIAEENQRRALNREYQRLLAKGEIVEKQTPYGILSYFRHPLLEASRERRPTASEVGTTRELSWVENKLLEQCLRKPFGIDGVVYADRPEDLQFDNRKMTDEDKEFLASVGILPHEGASSTGEKAE